MDAVLRGLGMEEICRVRWCRGGPEWAVMDDWVGDPNVVGDGCAVTVRVASAGYRALARIASNHLALLSAGFTKVAPYQASICPPPGYSVDYRPRLRSSNFGVRYQKIRHGSRTRANGA